MVPNDLSGQIVSTAFCVLRADPAQADPGFIYYSLLTEEFIEQIRHRQHGASYPAVTDNDVFRQEIPVPPVHEQRVIARCLSKIQASVGIQHRIVTTLSQLKAATMAKLFREGLRGEPLKQTEIDEIPESWRVVPLGRIARIGNGSTPKRDNLSYWESGTIPWLTSAKVHEGVIEQADEFVSETARVECHLPLVRKNSIVVAITGEGRTLGNAALVKFETCVSQHLAYVQFDSEEVVPEFMLLFLQGRYGHLRRASQAGGSTKRALTCGFLKGFLVPLPSVREQSEIARSLSTLLRTLKNHEARRQMATTLFSSLLHLLMTGAVRMREGAGVGLGTAGPQEGPRDLSATPAVLGGVPEAVDRFVAELVREFQPDRVVQFGALVPGSPNANAEVGLLVIMPFVGRSLAQAIRIEREVAHGFALEVVAIRPEDVERAVEMGDPFVKGVLERGRTLYVRPGPARRRETPPRVEVPPPHGTVSEETLREIVQRIVTAVAPEKIILFGSAARGEMGPDSDVDLLVVKSGVHRRELAARLYRELADLPVPKDIVVATPEDLERHRDTVGLVYRAALREGRVVYAAA